MLTDIQKKLIYTSIDRSQLPQNMKQYSCELIIQQDTDTNQSQKYINFIHKQGKQPSFRLVLRKFKKPATLMHIYKLENQKLSIKGKIQKIAESEIRKRNQDFKFKELGSDEEDVYVQKKLIFQHQDSSDYQNDSEYSDSYSSQAGIAPNQQLKIKVKSALIQIFNSRKKVSSIRQLNQALKKQYKIKIPENSVKQITLKICISDKKSKGYSLKPDFIDASLQKAGEGKKKLKQNQYN